MPHFYRYRMEDNLELPSGGAGAGAGSVPSTAAAPAHTARVSLLGTNSEIPVASYEDSGKLVQMFALLESTIKELKDENQQLR